MQKGFIHTQSFSIIRKKKKSSFIMTRQCKRHFVFKQHQIQIEIHAFSLWKKKKKTFGSNKLSLISKHEPVENLLPQKKKKREGRGSWTSKQGNNCIYSDLNISIKQKQTPYLRSFYTSTHTKRTNLTTTPRIQYPCKRQEKDENPQFAFLWLTKLPE